MRLADYSVFLEDPANLKNEEEQWAERKFYLKNATALQEFIDLTKSTSVLEMGCGTGWIPLSLRPIAYTGVDNNIGCLSLCHQKNPNLPFIKADIRYLPQNVTANIVCSFAVLKHFGLHEWDAVFKSVVNRGKYALFTMQIAPEDFDDGEQYHHSWITMAHLEKAVKEAGHDIMELRVSAVAENGKGVEYLVWTNRIG